MSGDIKLNVGSDLVRCLGCNDLTTGKKFTLLLESDTNALSYSLSDSQFKVPNKIKTDCGIINFINQRPICNFGQCVILCSQPIDMNLHLIKYMKSPVNKCYAVNKAYADRINYKTAIGNIPNIAMTDHTHFTFPAAKAFASEKIIICEMWVERLADDWIASNVRNCVAWLSEVFQRFVPYDFLHWFPRQWLDSHVSPRLYRTTMSLSDYNHNVNEQFYFKHVIMLYEYHNS